MREWVDRPLTAHAWVVSVAVIVAIAIMAEKIERPAVTAMVASAPRDTINLARTDAVFIGDRPVSLMPPGWQMRDLVGARIIVLEAH
jgi:hypothetical protein